MPSTKVDQDSNPLDYYSRGNVPGNQQVVDFLAEVGVRRAKLPPEWLDRFLRAAGYSQALRKERIRAFYGPGESLPPSRPFNLPARRGDFLGRKPDLEAVLEALQSAWPVILIAGLPGVGKTTLALEVAYACVGQPRAAARDFTWLPFAYIVWTEEKALSFDDLLDTIAHCLGYSGLTQKPLTEKCHRINDILGQQPALLIVDNFETITDHAIADFVTRVPPGVKVLLISREEEHLLPPIFRRYPPARIRLGGLPDAEALTFVRQEAQRLADLRRGMERAAERARLEAVVVADNIALLPLAKATEGNPKALTMVLGYIADQSLPLPTLVRDLYAAAESVISLFDYLFQQAWERCEENARTLWQVIPFFATTARREALATAAGLQGRYFQDALEQLQGRSLLEVVEGQEGEPRYQAHPLVRSFPRLHGTPDVEHDARQRWMEWYLDFLKRHDPEDWPSFEALGEEYENVMAAITWALGNQHPNAPELVKRFWHYLYIRGHWRLCETCTREALEQATIQEDAPVRLWLASHLGWLFEEQGRVSEALQQLHEVEAEILALEQPALLAETGVLNYLGQVYRRQGDLQRAEAYLTRALAVAEQIGDRRSTLRVRYHLAWVQVEWGRMAEAEQWYRDLLMEARAVGWQRAEGYCAKRLARALVKLSQLEEAEQWLNHASGMADHWQEPLLQADILFERARLERQRAQLGEVPGAVQKARQLAENARDFYQRLEAHWDISEVQQFLAGLGGSFHG